MTRTPTYRQCTVAENEDYMAFFSSVAGVLQTLVIALETGLGIWDVINPMDGYGNYNLGANSQDMKQTMAN